MIDRTMAQEIDRREIDTELEGLRAAHRALDDLIRQLAAEGSADQLHLQRLKKRKLMLKDRISTMATERIPDIIA
ncbi:YdcH family protein [Geminicoccus harenae]|uniref:YdcH family protein n=1 Tax=Geminicoccus harenae TaxID=2498453 RepID=UPI002AB06264|nr:YdcH family protein [Geminicoccus harenae]